MSIWDKNDTRSPGRLTVNVDADVDESVFVYLTARDDETGQEYLDVLLTEPADVDEFEQEVMQACAAFRRLRAEQDQPPQAGCDGMDGLRKKLSGA